MFLVTRQALAVPCQGPFVAGPAVISIPINAGQPVHTAIPVAAWNGAGHGVAFTGLLAGKRDIYFVLIDATGDLMSGPVRVADTLPDTDGFKRIVWTGQEYGVAWSDQDAVYFMRIDATGSPVGSLTILTADSNGGYLDSLAWTGSEYALTWGDFRHGTGEIYLARLDVSGTPIVGETRITNDPADSYLSSLARAGTGYGLVWVDERSGVAQVLFSRLDEQGSPIGNEHMLTSSPEYASDLVLRWTGGGFGLAWTEYEINTGATTLYAGALDPDGTMTSGPTTVASSDQYMRHTLAWTGSEFGLAWDVFETPRWRIRFARVSATAAVLGTPLLVNDTVYGQSPSVAWTGDGFGIFAEDGGEQILYHRIDCSCLDTSDGDGDGAPACHDCDDTRSDVYPGAPETCDGVDQDCNGAVDDGFDTCGIGGCARVVFNCIDGAPQTCEPGTPSQEICDGVDNDCDGVVDGMPDCAAACESPDLQADETLISGLDLAWAREIDLTWTGSGYGVVWKNNVGTSPGLGIHFVPLDGAGNPSGAGLFVTNDPGDGAPVLVWTGQEHGLAWDDGNEIQFTRLDAMGNRLAPNIPVTMDPAYSASPDMIWTGAEYALAWVEERDGDAEIYFTRLDPSGNKIGGDVRITEAPGDSAFPLLAWNGTDYGLTWQDSRDGFYRLYFMTLDPGGQPLGPAVRLSDGEFVDYQTRILWMGSEFAVFWTTDDGTSSEVFLSRLDPAGSRITPDVLLTEGAGGIWIEDVSWVGSAYGYIVSEWVGDSTRQTFVRSSTTGVPLGPPVEINAVRHTISARLQWNEEGFGLVYTAGAEPTSSHDVYWRSIRCDCTDGDGDGVSFCSDCDDANPSVYPAAPEQCNGVDDDCDGFIDEPSGSDLDGDGVDDVCDNCLIDPNPSQGDIDDDFEGDICDLDDGLIYAQALDQSLLSWQFETGFDTFNVYRGDVGALVDGDGDGAADDYGACLLAGILPQLSFGDTVVPAIGFANFYIVTGNGPSGESTFGNASSGALRSNPNPTVCGG
jgi:hypothetical protein